MEDIESVIKVYFTLDYKRFNFIKGNRLLSPNKIKKLMDTIADGLNILRYAPIIVDDDYNIIDGQHRYYVSCKLKHNVYYIKADKKKVSEIAKINSAMDKWKIKDFLESYITTGNDNYIELEKFVEKYKLPLGICIRLLVSGKVIDGSNNSTLEDFRNGLFKIEKEDEACRFAEILMDYRQYTELYKQRPFQQAVMKIINHENYDHEYMLEKSKKSKIIIEKKQSAKDYIIQLMSVFNFHNQKMVSLL